MAYRDGGGEIIAEDDSDHRPTTLSSSMIIFFIIQGVLIAVQYFCSLMDSTPKTLKFYIRQVNSRGPQTLNLHRFVPNKKWNG